MISLIFEMPVKFLAGHNTIICGQSQCGKTHFMLQVIDKKLIEPMPDKIFFMYNCEQEFMKHYPNVTFIKGLDFSLVEPDSVLIIDDLALETNKEVSKTFLMSSHHSRLSVFLITQTLFLNCNIFRTISLNAHYMVLFQNRRSHRQVSTLAHQVFCGKDVDRILNAYKRACSKDRGFVLLSFSPLLPSELTVLTDFWSQCPSIYL